jgi:hypothetical protein
MPLSFLAVGVRELRLVGNQDQHVELAGELERHLIVLIVTGVSVSAPTSKSGLLHSSPSA